MYEDEDLQTHLFSTHLLAVICCCVGRCEAGFCGWSVFEVDAGSEHSQQLLLVLRDVPLQKLLTGAQQTLEGLHIDHCNARTTRETDTRKQRERHAHTQRERETHTHTHTERDRHTHTERDTHTQRNVFHYYKKLIIFKFLIIIININAMYLLFVISRRYRTSMNTDVIFQLLSLCSYLNTWSLLLRTRTPLEVY